MLCIDFVLCYKFTSLIYSKSFLLHMCNGFEATPLIISTVMWVVVTTSLAKLSRRGSAFISAVPFRRVVVPTRGTETLSGRKAAFAISWTSSSVTRTSTSVPLLASITSSAITRLRLASVSSATDIGRLVTSSSSSSSVSWLASAAIASAAIATSTSTSIASIAFMLPSISASELVFLAGPIPASRVLVSRVAVAVALVGEVVGLLLGHLVRLAPVDPVESLGLNELVDLCCGDSREEFLHFRMRDLLSGCPHMSFVRMHRCEASSASKPFVGETGLVVGLLMDIKVLIML